MFLNDADYFQEGISRMADIIGEISKEDFVKSYALSIQKKRPLYLLVQEHLYLLEILVGQSL